MTTALTRERYLELIDRDTDRLLAMGERGLKAAVPSCPGWDVAEVVWHVANVYEHKVRVMANNAWPDPWPPKWPFADDEELAFLTAARDHLFEEFARHDSSEQTTTFGADSTIAFWVRRMACEIAIHRYDAELAHEVPTPIDPELALDGVDEFLNVMLAGAWSSKTEHPVDAAVAVETGEMRWWGHLSAGQVSFVQDSGEQADLTVSGAPEQVFLWLWGRAEEDQVRIDGDSSVVPELRARIVEATQ